ncbi:MAG: sigma-E processing peptidase SpoIIGA [Bacillota bacterium]|nr:sigma-E processing peptidase SpoIIGA [Bacillota bacterium]
MTVWGELLFLENGVTGLLILSLTGRLLGTGDAAESKVPEAGAGLFRLALGSVLCGLCGFTVFLQGFSWIFRSLFSLAFSAGLMGLVFPGKLKQLPRKLLVFYLVSLLMGGVTVGLMFLTGMGGMRFAGGFYIAGWGAYLYVLAGMGLTWLLTWDLVRFLRTRLAHDRVTARVEVEVEGRRALWKGLVDTGNFLCDPLTGAPVLLVKEERLRALLPEGIPAARMRWIPYHGVGVDHGALVGLRADRVAVAPWEPGRRPAGAAAVSGRAVLAVYRGRFPPDDGTGEYAVILPPGLAPLPGEGRREAQAYEKGDRKRKGKNS